MTAASGRPSHALKGRDLDAIHGFAKRLRAALPDAVREVRFLGSRTLDVPAEAAAPTARQSAARRPHGAPPPPPRPPCELWLAIGLERRDVFVEEQIDELASQLSRELGTVVAPFAYTLAEWEGQLRATRLADAFERGEVLG